jgi:hypothetical protein
MLYLFIYAILFAISLRTYGFRRVNRTRDGRDVTVIYRNKNNSLEIEINRRLFSLRVGVIFTKTKDRGSRNIRLKTENCYEAYDYRHAYRALDYMVLRGYSPELVPFDLKEDVNYELMLEHYGFILKGDLGHGPRLIRYDDDSLVMNVMRCYDMNDGEYWVTEELCYKRFSKKVLHHSFCFHWRGDDAFARNHKFRPDQLAAVLEYFKLAESQFVNNIPKDISMVNLKQYLFKRYQGWFAGMERKYARYHESFKEHVAKAEFLKDYSCCHKLCLAMSLDVDKKMKELQGKACELVEKCVTVTGFALYAGLPSMILR